MLKEGVEVVGDGVGGVVGGVVGGLDRRKAGGGRAGAAHERLD